MGRRRAPLAVRVSPVLEEARAAGEPAPRSADATAGEDGGVAGDGLAAWRDDTRYS